MQKKIENNKNISKIITRRKKNYEIENNKSFLKNLKYF
jgi:hypothetical protein